MGYLALNLLGPLQVYLDGRPVAGFESQKVRALLVYLALNADRPHGRDALAGLLWPEQPDLDARNNLRQALANLRQTLGERAAARPFLLITRDTIQFNPASDHRIDAVAFTALLDACHHHPHRRDDACSSCARRLKQATELYRGSFLEAFFLGDSAAFEEWVLLTRERLQARAVAALGQLIGYHERRGAYEQARDYTRRQLALEPWREESHRALMRLLALGGQRSAALQQFATCKNVLAMECGAEPETTTVELYQQIMRGDIPTPRPTSNVLTNLAAYTPPTPFIGRARELGQLTDWLEDRQCRLLTLVGAGGVGKTRLAIEAAAQVRESFPDGVWFVNLAPLHDPESLVSAIAQTVRVQEVAGQSLQDSVNHALRHQQILLVLDNFEQIVEAAPVVGRLLAAAPGLAVLATSRQPLRLSGEHEVALAPLAVPEPAQVQNIASICDTDAVRLFVNRAQAIKADFALSDENAAAVAAICARLDGLPLAIELAAARVKVFPPQALLARLDQRLSFLTNGARDLPVRQQTLRATLEWSYGLLDPDAQMLFTRLGVFVGGCTLEASEAVCNDDALPSAQIAMSLEALVAHSLVKVVERSAGEPRFMMLETIREYALERLEKGAAEKVRRAYVDYYLNLAETAEPELRGSRQRFWQERLNRESDNVQAALVHGEIQTALRLCLALWRFWYTHPLFREGYRWLVELLASDVVLPPQLEAKALNLAGRLAHQYDNNVRSKAYLESGLTLCRELNNQAGIAYALRHLGALAYRQGQHDRAALLCQESLTICYKLEGKEDIAASLFGLAWAVEAQGDFHQAIALHQASLDMYQELGDTLYIARAYFALGHLYLRQGDYPQARMAFEKRLAFEQELDNLAGAAHTLSRLALTALGQGDYVLAGMQADKALDLARQACAYFELVWVVWIRGHVAIAQEDCVLARKCFKESLDLLKTWENNDSPAWGLWGLGQVAVVEGQAEEAAALFAQSLQMFQAVEYQHGIICALEGFAGHAAAQREPERAAHLCGAATRQRAVTGRLHLLPDERLHRERAIHMAQAQLGDNAFATAWAAGQAMTLEQAIAEALAEA